MRSHKITRTSVNGIIEREVDLANCINTPEIIRNNIEARCQIIQGELEYDTSIGVPLGLDKEETDLMIMNTINNTNGVEEITEFTSKIVNRKYMLNAKVKVTDGSILEVTL